MAYFGRIASIEKTRFALGGVSSTTVYELVKRGELVKVNIGRRGFITTDSINAFIDRITADA